MYILVYLNNSSEPNSFMVKLSAISLLVMFLVVGGMSSLLINNHDDMYTEKQLARVSAIRHMLNENLAAKYEDLAFVCVVPGSSPDAQGLIYQAIPLSASKNHCDCGANRVIAGDRKSSRNGRCNI
jgi:hypothetical protein